jgi:hypothetical protein
MERLIKNILLVKPNTIEKVQELQKDAPDVTLEELKARITVKLSELKPQVKIIYIYIISCLAI